MSSKEKKSAEKITEGYERVIKKQTGKAVRPDVPESQFREDGYVNMMNKYGTSKDTSENYSFVREPDVPDEELIEFYEGNGLFARIIDAPSEEAVKHGFELKDLTDDEIVDFYTEALDELDWEETAMTALKWSRLMGGSLIVMLINDGRGIDEPVDWKNIQSIDDMRVYDRSLIVPDTTSLFTYRKGDPFRTRGSRLGKPERYHIYSKYGNFTVHESRCLDFPNGVLPEGTTNSEYELWGMPEYIRLRRAIRDVEISVGSSVKMLDKSIQPIYKMKNLAQLLSTEDGEDKVVKRMQVIDLARGLLNSLVIDSDGEDYDFKQFQYNGVTEIINSAFDLLSALSSIPQTILFGKPPAGMGSEDRSSLENYYNYVERIQKRVLKKNLRYLLSVIFQAGMYTGEIEEVPKIKIEFSPLWSLSESEQADLDAKKVQNQSTRANTAKTYVDMQAVDPSEVRKGLAESEEFDIENMLDDYEDEDDLFANMPANNEQGEEAEEGNSPDAAPEATKLPQDMDKEQLAENALKSAGNEDSEEEASLLNEQKKCDSVGVVVISHGKILTGKRAKGFGKGLICGPGGHIEQGETPEEAAIRETEEEFGIVPESLLFIGYGEEEPDTGLVPAIYLCTEYTGEVKCKDGEICSPEFVGKEKVEGLVPTSFQPFVDGLKMVFDEIGIDYRFDEEPSDWITVNGNAIPIGEKGDPIGGQLKAFGDKYNSKEKKNHLNKLSGYVKSLKPDVEYPERVRYWKKEIKRGNHRPVLVSKDDHSRIIDGNHTLKAYMELGITPEIYEMDRVEFLNGAAESQDTVEFIKKSIESGKATKVNGNEDGICAKNRTDEEPSDWITVNGNHIPIDGDGKPIGGQMKALGGASKKKSHTFKNEELGNTIKDLSKYPSGSYLPIGIEKNAMKARKSFANDEGFEVTTVPGKMSFIYDEQSGDYKDGVEVFSPDLTYKECNIATKLANGCDSGISEERYCEICREHGIEPRLHSEPLEAPEWMTMTKSGKQRKDSTPVYTRVGVSEVLTDEELTGYANASSATTEEQENNLKEAAQKAISEMSDKERSAVTGYTSQYGYGSYDQINKYLAGDDPNASQATKEAAEQIVTALDHPIGEKCVTFRGTGEIRTIAQSDELQKVVEEISKNNFSHASKLVEGLEGKEFESPAVISASDYQDANYGKRPIQIIFKTPAEAKAVKVSAISKYAGGRSEAEKALANTGLFGTVQTESEVAYKPGTRYKIEKVVCSADTDRKDKPQGKVFLVCSILTDNHDSRTENFEEDSTLESEKSESIKPFISENSIDKSTQNVKIKSEKNTMETDGGPGSGNFGHEGVKGQKGGSKRRLSKDEKAKIVKRFVGSKTSDGIEIKSFGDHAFDRIAERKISNGRIQNMLNSTVVSPDKTHADRRVYDVPGSRMVVNINTGEIVTFEWRRQNKK